MECAPDNLPYCCGMNGKASFPAGSEECISRKCGELSSHRNVSGTNRNPVLRSLTSTFYRPRQMDAATSGHKRKSDEVCGVHGSEPTSREKKQKRLLRDGSSSSSTSTLTRHSANTPADRGPAEKSQCREGMILKIREILNRRKRTDSTLTVQERDTLARKLEDILYRSASSKPEYTNPLTLLDRLRCVIKKVQEQKGVVSDKPRMEAPGTREQDMHLISQPMFTWEWARRNGDTYHPFSPAANHLLESHHQHVLLNKGSVKPQVEVDHDGASVAVDVQQMTMKMPHRSLEYSVRRVDHAEYPPSPPTWSHKDPTNPYKIVPLAPGTKEYRMVRELWVCWVCRLILILSQPHFTRYSPVWEMLRQAEYKS